MYDHTHPNCIFIGCIDCRLAEIHRQTCGAYPWMYPGGAAAIPQFEMLLHQIIVGKGITELVLMTHDDCAGCELLGITKPAEAMRHEAEKLHRAFPDLKITCYHKHLINDDWVPVRMERIKQERAA